MQVPHPQTGKRNKAVEAQYYKSTSTGKNMGTLNYTARKVENERIYSENLKLFQKLSAQKGSYNTNDFEKRFNDHKKHLKTLTKTPMIVEKAKNLSPDPSKETKMLSRTIKNMM